MITVLTGIDFGEGPRWHQDRLWFSDFYRQRVFSVDSEGNEQVELTLDDRPSGLGWLPDGTMLVVAMTSQRVLAVEPDGGMRVHADLSAIATGHCNDLVVSATGHAYVGNFGFDSEGGGRFAAASLAHVTPDGQVHEAAEGLMFPNGSVITSDGSTLVVGETYAGQYTAWDIADDGTLSNRRIWGRFEGTSPDGCCLDVDGAIWMADFVGRRVLRVHEGGAISAEIPVDGHAVACMLGGGDRRTLYVLVSPGSHPDDVAGRGLSSLVSTRVDVPGAGLP